MAIVRNLVLLGAAVALLPTDQAQQARFYDQAASAVNWTLTFCDRNATVCNEGQELWATFVKKAEFGAGVAYDLVQRQIAGSGGTTPLPAAYPAAPSAPSPRGTLRPDDLEPRWRGAPSGGAAGRPADRRGA